MEDKPLFGPVDQVVNTLECEITWVKGEIKRCQKAILRSQSEIDTLETRLKNLGESMKIVRKKAEDEKPEEPAVKAPAAKAKKTAKK